MRFATCALTAALGCLAWSVAIAGPAQASNNDVCLDADHIVATTVIDDQTVLYHMRGNVIWKNTLQKPCPGLKFEQGFSEEIRSGFICSNTQLIRVLRTGAVCSLGPFTPYVPPVKPSP